MEMNWTQNCLMLRNLFKTEGIDKMLLKIGYGVLSVLILAVNVAVIKSLLTQRRKKRTCKLFILLSVSDVVVGAVTIPLAMLLFYTYIPEDTYCKLVPVIIYFIYAPFKFSWLTTILIAVDRVLMITQRNLHLKYMTDKMICIIVIFNFCAANSIALWHLLSVKYSTKILEQNAFNITLSVLEMCLILVTTMLYIYLLWYVRKKCKIMECNRITNERRYGRGTTQTTANVFVCLVVCNLTQLLGLIFVTWSKTKSNIIIRNAIFWPTLALYMNSFLNAVILMHRGRKSDR